MKNGLDTAARFLSKSRRWRANGRFWETGLCCVYLRSGKLRTLPYPNWVESYWCLVVRPTNMQGDQIGKISGLQKRQNWLKGF